MNTKARLVFDNIIFSKEKQGGISNYWSEIIKEYAENKNAFFFEEKGASDNLFRKNFHIRNSIPHKQYPVFFARLAPVVYPPKNDMVLYHSSFYRKLITRSKVCEVTTVHDFLHQQHSTPAKRFVHNKLKFAAIKRSKGIICVSNNTFSDLQKYCPSQKNQKVTVIYNGVSAEYQQLGKNDSSYSDLFNELRINQKFLLYVGARSKYKNFEFVVSLLEQLPAYKLVVVGNDLSPKERSKISEKTLERIVVAKNIPNYQLNILYNYAHALLYPSSYEGFGIPVAEAMKAGCPVLALNVSSIPEVSGGAASLYDQLNIRDFRNGIELLENDDQRMSYVEKGLNNARKFDWATCSRETTEFYQEVFGSDLYNSIVNKQFEDPSPKPVLLS